jgi:hypothetical protein
MEVLSFGRTVIPPVHTSRRTCHSIQSLALRCIQVHDRGATRLPTHALATPSFTRWRCDAYRYMTVEPPIDHDSGVNHMTASELEAYLEMEAALGAR